MKKTEKRKSKIGGQALIEGVMMRGLDKVSMAVRLPNKKIDIETWQVGSLVNPKWYRKIPIIRGVVGMVSSLALGYKCLMKSAEKAAMGEESLDEAQTKENQDGAQTKEDQAKNEGITKNIIKIAGIVGTVLAVVISIGLFMFIPSWVIKALNSTLGLNNFSKAILEGILKIIIFVAYLVIISLMPDMRRTFQYHGAEHKTIACYEADCELTVENVKQFTRFHPRCGTSFLIIVMIISIIVFSVITWDNLLIRIVLKFALLPVVTGCSFEIIQLAGRYTNTCTKIVSAPGLWLQRLTTNEPDESQIEVAIAAFNQVIPENKDEDQW